MPQHSIDLGFVLGNTLSGLGWTGFTLFCALAIIGVMWCVLPFAVFGVKRRLDAIESAQRQQTELLAGELRRTNELLIRRLTGAASAPTTIQQADPWHAVPAQPEPAVAPVAVNVRTQPTPLAPVLVQATQPQQQYAPYPDDPRPAAPAPRRELRWTRFGQQNANGSAA
jgi:hypothetical protein